MTARPPASVASGQPRRRRASRLARSLMSGLLTLAVLPTHPAMGQVELDSRVFEVASELRCPVCTSESVAQSSATTSFEMRTIIADLLSQGKSKAEILEYFQRRYGDWILLRPPRRGVYLWIWWAPVLGVVGLLAMLVALARRWLERGAVPVTIDDDALERVHHEVAVYEESP